MAEGSKSVRAPRGASGLARGLVRGLKKITRPARRAGAGLGEYLIRGKYMGRNRSGK